MPTGYTADIEKGISFYKFALTCARAFGALVHMRDDGPNVEIPDKIEPDTYHRDRLITLSTEFHKWLAADNREMNQLARQHYEQQIAYNKERIREAKALKYKYKQMLAQAEAYTPPTPDHENFKKFMIEQLKKSMDSDCYVLKQENVEPDMMTGEEYRKMQIDMCLQSIERSSKEYRKAIESAENRTQWIQALKKSLEPYRRNPDKIIAASAGSARIEVTEKGEHQWPKTRDEALQGVQGGMEAEKIGHLYNIDGSLKED